MCAHVLVATLGLSGSAIARGATVPEWQIYQRQFQQLCAATLDAEPEPSPGGGRAERGDRRRQILSELAASDVELHEVLLPDAGIRELCTSCHLGIDDALFEDAPAPFRSHPGTLIEQHEVGKFGCTLCHQGDGEGTTVAAAHGTGEQFARPLLPLEYVQSSCASCHETSFMLAGAEKLERGRQIFSTRGCYACHAARGFEDRRKLAGPLHPIGTKLANASWLRQWLRGPAKLRPGTLMPDFRLTDAEVGDLAAYLLSATAEAQRPNAISLHDASTDEGERLFVERGCRGCHSAAAEEPSISPRVPNLSDIGLKVTPEWLMAWLENPRTYNPDTLMPRTELTEEERRDLTAYLMTRRSSEDVLKPREDPALADFDPANGKHLVEIYGCYGCHALAGFEHLPPPGAGVAAFAGVTLDELDFGDTGGTGGTGDTTVRRTKWDWLAGKIESPRLYDTEERPLRSPVFALEAGDVDALTTYYLSHARAELPVRFLASASHRVRTLRQGDWLVTAYGCRGCHRLEAGQDSMIAEHLDRKYLLPPPLLGEGKRVQPQWMFQYLRAPSSLRPWLQIRMPDFGLSHEDNEAIVRYFAMLATGSAATFPYVVEPARESIAAEEVAMGEYRVRTDKCVQCHPVSLDKELPEGVTLEDLSIDLMLTKTRLRFDWIKDFLRDPDEYAGADTRMPFVYYDPEGRPKIPDPELWIDLTAKFLMVMEELPEPVVETLDEIRPGSDVDWTTYDP